MSEQITFQFSTESRWKDIDSALIRWRTDCEYSHVDIVLPSELLLGARLHGGVQRRPLRYAPFSKTMLMSVPVTGQAALAGYHWLSQQVGKPYDWRGIVGLALYRNWKDQSAWFCSELAFAFAEKCGAIDFAQNLPEANVNWLSPRDLILVLGAINGARQEAGPEQSARIHDFELRDEFRIP